MSKKKFRTDFLFPKNGFIMGAGSIFNLGGRYFEVNSSSTDEIADRRAIYNDWAMIGQDLKDVVEKNPKDSMANNARY